MSDRHFDQLATRFAEKIYGGAKGAIRLAVLQADLAEALPDRPLRVLDIGGGLGEGPGAHGDQRGADGEQVEGIDEGVGEQPAVLADVGLVVGEEAQGEGEVERPGQADPEQRPDDERQRV